MPKQRFKVHFRLPCYLTPRNAWRAKIHEAALGAVAARGIQYDDCDRLAITVRLYLDGNALVVHDIDNRLKDILDALQGRMGGPKARRPLRPVIRNDRQIWSATITKALPPRQSHGLGHVTIVKLR